MTALASRPTKGVRVPGRAPGSPAVRKPVLKAPARIEFWHRFDSDGDLEIRIMGLRLHSEANERCHWSVRYRRNKAQQRTVLIACIGLLLHKRFGNGSINVRLVRIGPRRIDPDNLAGSFKGVIDSLARSLERDDGDESIAWEYRQQRLDARTYGLVIEISHAAKGGE